MSEQQMVTPEVVEEIIAAYQENTTYEDMKETFNMPRNQIYQVLKAAGAIGKRSKAKRYNYNKKLRVIGTQNAEAIIKAYKCGISVKKIAKKLSVSYEDVRQILIASDIKIRDLRVIEDPERINEVITAYKNGMSWEEMQEQFEVKARIIAMTLKIANVSLGSEIKDIERDLNAELPNPITVQLLFEIKEAYESGKIIKEICKIYRLSYKTVSTILRRLGVEIETKTYKRVITDELLAAVNEAHEKGMNRHEIQEEFNISHGTCYNILRQLNLVGKKREKNVLYDPQKIELVIQLYKSGMSMSQIAETHNFNYESISVALKNAGIAIRTGHNSIFSQKEKLEKLIALYKDGKTFAELELEFEVSSTTIKRALKKAGVLVTREHILNDAENEKIIMELYEKGYTVEEIVEKTCLESKKVRKILKKHNVDIGIQNRYLSLMSAEEKKEKIAELVEDYKKGVEWRILQSKYHLNTRGLSKILKEAGVVFRSKKA